MKEEQLEQKTVLADRLRRDNTELNAELDDLDSRMVASQEALDKAQRDKGLLEQQIRDAYSEAQDARARADRLQDELDRSDTNTVEHMEAKVQEFERLCVAGALFVLPVVVYNRSLPLRLLQVGSPQHRVGGHPV